MPLKSPKIIYLEENADYNHPLVSNMYLVDRLLDT